MPPSHTTRVYHKLHGPPEAYCEWCKAHVPYLGIPFARLLTELLMSISEEKIVGCEENGGHIPKPNEIVKVWMCSWCKLNVVEG